MRVDALRPAARVRAGLPSGSVPSLATLGGACCALHPRTQRRRHTWGRVHTHVCACACLCMCVHACEIQGCHPSVGHRDAPCGLRVTRSGAGPRCACNPHAAQVSHLRSRLGRPPPSPEPRPGPFPSLGCFLFPNVGPTLPVPQWCDVTAGLPCEGGRVGSSIYCRHWFK